MRKIYLVGKILAVVVFGILGSLSLMMFPLLIGSVDSETSILGYSYLGILLISISVYYFIISNELKRN